MKNYIIQDLEDHMYYVSNNKWSDNINDAVPFLSEEDAWNTALNKSLRFLTVIPIIY